MRQTTFSSYLG